MSCKNPLIGKQYFDTTTGKWSKLFHIESAKKYEDEGQRIIREYDRYRDKNGREIRLVKISCGCCSECRLEHSRQWANRCMLETRDHENNYFITLTYDQEHLPISKKRIDTKTGEILPNERPTLDFDDLQKFFKKLRRYYEYHYGIKEQIRYFACGEYGELRGRPHYHAIIFGLPIPDLKQHHKNAKGNMNYTSEILTKIWGKGIVAVGSVTWDSCAYTARYVMKKQKGNNKYIYDELGIVAENVRMSRNPGIARKYFDENKNKIYEADQIWINKTIGVQKIKPPRYYDKLFDLDQHEQLNEIKKRRKQKAELFEKNFQNQCYLMGRKPEEVKEEQQAIKELKQKTLKRNYETGKSLF